MKLKQVSRLFFGMVSLVLLLNLGLLQGVRLAQDHIESTFSRAEEELKAQGYDPVNPFRNGLPDEAHWRAHMRADIALLLACDYIYMLKDWELSKGAKLELDVASSCGIKVLFE